MLNALGGSHFSLLANTRWQIKWTDDDGRNKKHLGVKKLKINH